MSLLHRIVRIGRDEDGSSLTEFVMFLPVFVMVFAGMVNLGKMNMVNTKVQLNAAQNMWDQAIPIASSGLDTVHTSPISGSGAAGVQLGEYATDGDNGQQAADGVEAAIMVVGAADGHWGESYGRVKPFHALGMADKEPKIKPKDILKDRAYPTQLMNDGLVRSMPTSVVGAIMSAISASGFIHAQGAGIRYGAAFGEDTQTVGVGNIGDYNVEAHYDVLVPPSPRKTDLEHVTTVGLAWLMTQEEHNYEALLVFGSDEHLESDSSNDSLGLGQDANDAIGESNEESGKKDDEVGDAQDELAEQQAAEAEGGG